MPTPHDVLDRVTTSNPNMLNQNNNEVPWSSRKCCEILHTFPSREMMAAIVTQEECGMSAGLKKNSLLLQLLP